MSEKDELRFHWMGFTMGVRDVTPEVLDVLARAWPAFLTDQAPDCWIRGARGAAPVSGLISVLPQAFATADGGLRIEGEGFEANVAPDRREVLLSGIASFDSVSATAKLLLAERVRQRGGLLVHGVAVRHRGKVALFTGESGAGKSTLGGLCAQAGRTVLADELVAVIPREDCLWAEGTPWNIGQPGEGRLALWGTLAHSSTHALEPISASAQLRVLLSNVLLLERSAPFKAEAFRIAAELLRDVPCVRLSFALSSDVADVISAALERT